MPWLFTAGNNLITSCEVMHRFRSISSKSLQRNSFGCHLSLQGRDQTTKPEKWERQSRVLSVPPYPILSSSCNFNSPLHWDGGERRCTFILWKIFSQVLCETVNHFQIRIWKCSPPIFKPTRAGQEPVPDKGDISLSISRLWTSSPLFVRDSRMGAGDPRIA